MSSLVEFIPGKPIPEFSRAEILEEKSEWWYFMDGENEDVEALIDEKNLVQAQARAELSAYVSDHMWFEQNPHRRTRLRLPSQQEIKGLAAGELFQLNAVLCAVVRRYDAGLLWKNACWCGDRGFC
jgi:hypothetical protein